MNQFVTVSFPSPGVVTFTIDRPPVNAACTELYDELRHLPITALRSVARMRGKVRKLLALK